ncbi:hypothetical protein [Fictibacillus sp. UD]|uniref:hypothetical protein n=1 Tax=Fictibacillus sp. UD TaxID=3038777 RepID=UPI0037486780
MKKEQYKEKRRQPAESTEKVLNKRFGAVISAPGYMLSAGRAVSPMPLRVCPTRPAGVSTLPLQSLQVCIKTQKEGSIQLVSPKIRASHDNHMRGSCFFCLKRKTFEFQPVFQCPLSLYGCL